MSYTVKEVFHTIQGEGVLAGTPAVFIRLAGCNLWTGRQEDRERDARHHRVACPLWCDTDFRRGTHLEAEDVVELVKAEKRIMGPPLIVLTGGEPLLQVDRELVDALQAEFPRTRVAVETNGTVPWPEGVVFDHVCVSPKVQPEELAIRRGHELKLVYPAHDPEPWRAAADSGLIRFGQYMLQPEANPGAVPGDSTLNPAHMAAAAKYCMDHPQWRLSIQVHKVVNLD